MTAQAVRDFLQHNSHAILATCRGDGGVQQSPVSVAVDTDGSLLISTRETAAKTANLRRDPRAFLCIIREQFWPPWAQVEGTVTVEPLPDAMEGLIRYYRLVAGEHPDWDEYRAAMEKEKRVLLHVKVERASIVG